MKNIPYYYSTKNEIFWINKLSATPSKKYKDRWDVDGNVYLINQYFTKLPLDFGIVTGNFYCNYNKLKTLEGSPIEVGGDYYFGNNSLEHLNDLNNIKIKGKLIMGYNAYINGLYNTNLDALEYTLNNHTYWFENEFLKNEFYTHIEQIVIKKRLTLLSE